VEIIKFENVCYEYIRLDEEQNIIARREALKNINLTVTEGEFVAVLGANGSGKSTLAKLINALLLPKTGKVFVNGYDTSGGEENIYKARKSAGMVFQNPDNQIIASIVDEDVAFGPENLALEPDVIKQRVQSALESVRMSEYADKSTQFLSGGQKQKLAIAGVLAMQPDIIVLDEPTAMLDPIGRKDVIKTVKRLNSEKHITIILITHFMDEAAAAARTVVMDDGRICLDAPPAAVFSDVPRVRDLRLDVPQISELSYKLLESGFDLPKGILTIKEMTDALCRLKQKT